MPVDDWRFYFITDSNLTKQGVIKDAEDAIRGGAKVVQYREKALSYESKIEEAGQLAALCRSRSVDLIINDDPRLASIVDAAGVHLGPKDVSIREIRADFPGIIGVSCSSLDDVERAEKDGADYIAVSPVFFTTTKKDISTPLGLEGVTRFRKATGLHLTAIGGITLENAREVIDAGADSICAISASVSVENVEASVRKFEGLFQR